MLFTYNHVIRDLIFTVNNKLSNKIHQSFILNNLQIYVKSVTKKVTITAKICILFKRENAHCMKSLFN